MLLGGFRTTPSDEVGYGIWVYQGMLYSAYQIVQYTINDPSLNSSPTNEDGQTSYPDRGPVTYSS